MTPLDLTQAPPRSPREELGGLCMLPRMIDIARAKLPGGRVGDYQIGRGMSGAVFRHLGIEAAAFVELVRTAADEQVVEERLCSRRSEAENRMLNMRLRRLMVATVPEDLRESFRKFYGEDLPPDKRVFDILEEDDARSFAKTAG